MWALSVGTVPVQQRVQGFALISRVYTWQAGFIGSMFVVCLHLVDVFVGVVYTLSSVPFLSPFALVWGPPRLGRFAFGWNHGFDSACHLYIGTTCRFSERGREREREREVGGWAGR